MIIGTYIIFTFGRASKFSEVFEQNQARSDVSVSFGIRSIPSSRLDYKQKGQWPTTSIPNLVLHSFDFGYLSIVSWFDKKLRLLEFPGKKYNHIYLGVEGSCCFYSEIIKYDMHVFCAIFSSKIKFSMSIINVGRKSISIFVYNS